MIKVTICLKNGKEYIVESKLTNIMDIIIYNENDIEIKNSAIETMQYIKC